MYAIDVFYRMNMLMYLNIKYQYLLNTVISDIQIVIYSLFPTNCY